MFMGEFHHNLDAKNRLVMPSSFLTELGDKFIITRGIEKCLYVYSETSWKEIVSKLKTLSFTKRNARAFMRTFFSGAVTVNVDKNGRFLLTSNEVEYASLTKECIIIGVNDRLEIWSKANWDEELKLGLEKLDDISESLFDGDYDAL